MIEAQVLEKPELKLIGLESPFIHALSPDSNNFKVIPPLWHEFSQRHNEVQNRADKAMYGIIYAKAEAQRTHPHELQYIAAVAVTSTATIPNGMVVHTIPAGPFAVFLHRGPIRNIADTCRQIYREWLPQSRFEHAEIADVELYDDRFQFESDDSEMEYWISVKRKQQ